MRPRLARTWYAIIHIIRSMSTVLYQVLVFPLADHCLDSAQQLAHRDRASSYIHRGTQIDGKIGRYSKRLLRVGVDSQIYMLCLAEL